jgi:aminopeptidase N
MKKISGIFALFLLVISQACNKKELKQETILEEDTHSFSKPEVTKVNHLNLDLMVNFDQKIIEGTACYDLESKHGNELILDNMGLKITEVHITQNGKSEPAKFSIDTVNEILGSGIRIQLNETTQKVCVHYSTGEDAKALQWLPKEQTLSKKFPFLFTQSQSIYARSWIPCPDGPGMRFTYDAKVKIPKGMMAVMSASNVQQKSEAGIYEFSMELPIPAYLMALAVGDFEFKKIGERTGVYAEPELIEKAAKEFDVLESMLSTAENLYGPYPWHRYDVIVLPSSFPFGGMENPRMTFLTPSVIAGDKSLTALLAHELAHSWSGNLVTNATWNDFWLNEGFTTYFESRIMESIYGKQYADMLSILGLQDLKKTLNEMGEENPLTKLKLDLKDKDPEDALSDVAYEKGKALLRFLEERTGRIPFDNFLRKYFAHFKFKSNTSEGFISFLKTELLNNQPGLIDTVNAWIYKPGWINFLPSYDDQKFRSIDNQLSRIKNNDDYSKLITSNWSTHEWIYAIRKLPKDKNPERCKTLENTFHLSQRNSEIQCCWLEYVIQNNYGPDLLNQISKFLATTGRRKYLMPVYKAMKENSMYLEAKNIFESTKDGYHPIARESVNELLLEKI